MDGTGDEANAADLTDTCLMRLCFLSVSKQNMLMSSSEDVCCVRGVARLGDSGIFVVISVHEARPEKQVTGNGRGAFQMYSQFQTLLPESCLDDSLFHFRARIAQIVGFSSLPL